MQTFGSGPLFAHNALLLIVTLLAALCSCFITAGGFMPTLRLLPRANVWTQLHQVGSCCSSDSWSCDWAKLFDILQVFHALVPAHNSQAEVLKDFTTKLGGMDYQTWPIFDRHLQTFHLNLSTFACRTCFIQISSGHRVGFIFLGEICLLYHALGNSCTPYDSFFMWRLDVELPTQ